MDRSTRAAVRAGNFGASAAGHDVAAPAPAGGQSALFADGGETDQRLARLARAIEGEIIPRLMLAHREAHACADSAEPCAVLAPGDVDAFTEIVLGADDDDALAVVEGHLARGVPVETVFVELLAPTAHRLGELWTQDRCHFTDVTLALGRLQRVLREVSAGLAPAGAVCDVGEPAEGARRILLLPSPGEQHTFGLVMVAELFRRAGWDVAGGPWELAADAPRLVADDWFDVVGFSLAAEMHAEALAQCIASVRQASCNGQVGIMVGGPVFRSRPELAQQLGADLTADDGRHAPSLASRFLVGRMRRP
ncbi:MAG: cobalamin B12-binding domain-containing protein [Rubrivivax sp.]|nr:cobalamin B12-binding domain-containing protein [Rubrivivax sp.]